jgi:hypothetical protein
MPHVPSPEQDHAHGPMSDPNLRALTALRRMRHVETDEARRDLGDAMAQETALVARDAAIRGELDTARGMTGEFDREAFAAWLRRSMTERARLADALKQAEAQSAAARIVLANRRLAETAAEEALARGVAAVEAEAARKDQLTLEDVARALKRAAQR